MRSRTGQPDLTLPPSLSGPVDLRRSPFIHGVPTLQGRTNPTSKPSFWTSPDRAFGACTPPALLLILSHTLFQKNKRTVEKHQHSRGGGGGGESDRSFPAVSVSLFTFQKQVSPTGKLCWMFHHCYCSAHTGGRLHHTQMCTHTHAHACACTHSKNCLSFSIRAPPQGLRVHVCVFSSRLFHVI